MMLGKIVSARQNDWDEFLPYVLSAYRSSIYEVAGFSPNYLIFRREDVAPIDVTFGQVGEGQSRVATYTEYAVGLAERLDTVYHMVRQSLGVAAEGRSAVTTCAFDQKLSVLGKECGIFRLESMWSGAPNGNVNILVHSP